MPWSSCVGFCCTCCRIASCVFGITGSSRTESATNTSSVHESSSGRSSRCVCGSVGGSVFCVLRAWRTACASTSIAGRGHAIHVVHRRVPAILQELLFETRCRSPLRNRIVLPRREYRQVYGWLARSLL